VVTEIPYGTNKARIIEQVAELTRAGRLGDVSDLRDESDRDGIRVVLELKRGADAVKVLNQLFKGTALQSTFGVIALALVNGTPRELGLKEILEHWRNHRVEVVQRRSRWELARAQDEAHVLRGLIVALGRIDEVVQIIRTSRNRESAGSKLQKELKLDERQSDAILAMRLSRLTQLETRELKDRLGELEARIRELEAILASPERQLELIRADLREMAATYADPRRTRIIENEKAVKLEDMLAAEHVVVTVSREGFVRQIPMAVYQRAMTAGKGLALDRYESDFITRAFVASTEDSLLAFSSDGRAYGLSVRDVPESGLTSRGKALGQIFELGKKAEIPAVHLVHEFRADRFVLFATADGTVKRTALDQYANARAGGIEAIKVGAKDRVVDVRITDGEGEVVLMGRGGRAIRFPEAEVPLMGRAAQGVRGIKLKPGESVAGMAVPRREGGELVIVTERGWAKRVPLDELQPQGRGGLGTALLSPAKDTGDVAAAREVHPGEDLMAVTGGGRVARIRVEQVAKAGRAGNAEKTVTLTGGERVAEVTYVAERERPESAVGDESDEPRGDASALAGTPGDDSADGAPGDYSAADDPVADGPATGEPDEPAAPPPEDGAASATELDLFS